MKKGVKKEGKKLKIAVIISIISVLIAIISIFFSVYVGIRDLGYKENARQMQMLSQELQKKGLEFDENYKKIELAEKSIIQWMESCRGDVNQARLDENLKLLIKARSALIKNDISLAEDYLNQINENDVCNIEIVSGYLFWEIGILIFVWAVLIASFIRVIWKR